jgi:uncharacterized membrane protein YdjX (TVP38/TMEM64 family)
MENFKGYVYTIFSGVLLAVAAIFTALQWDYKSHISVFGKDLPDVSTSWLVLGSAAGGLLAYWLVRLLARGARILLKVRTARRADERQKPPAEPAEKEPAPARAPDKP